MSQFTPEKLTIITSLAAQFPQRDANEWQQIKNPSLLHCQTTILNLNPQTAARQRQRRRAAIKKHTCTQGALRVPSKQVVALSEHAGEHSDSSETRK